MVKNTAYLSLGSNMGNRAENILSALSFLTSSNFAELKKVSSFYETTSVGKKQRNFYNIAAQIKTALNPFELLDFLKQGERLLGRKPAPRWSKRIIDMDILFYNGETIKNPRLTVPHKEIQNRLFVLIPLCEISPNLIHPALNNKIKNILNLNLLTLPKQKVKMIMNI